MDIPDITSNYGSQPSNYANHGPGAMNEARRAASESVSGETAATDIRPADSAAQQPAMANEALKAAGLKETENNLRLVSLLLENEMPINKESLIALSRLTRLAGTESAEKALFLMKNNIPLTLGALEALEAYTGENSKIISGIEELAKNIMELPDAPVKTRLLQIFPEAAKAAEAPVAPQPGRTPPAPAKAGEAAAVTPPPPQTANTPQTPRGLPARGEALPQPANAERATPQQIPETGTSFFRETFSAKNVYAHVRAHPLPAEAEQFIDRNLEKLKDGFAELTAKNNVTKEGVAELFKGVAQGKLPINPENDAELTSFTLKLAEKSGLLDESVERAEKFSAAVQRGAKKIAGGLSLLLDEEKGGEKLDKVIENLKDKLSVIAKEMGGGKGAEKILGNIEDIKDNLKFLNSLKNDTLLQIPIIINGEQRRAELYIFSRKGGGKGKEGQSQSALLALDLANLGHLETYVRKEGRKVACQFRLENNETEPLVRENIKRLYSALREKNYTLESVIYKKIDEKFTVLDEEPSVADTAVKAKAELQTFDLKT